MCGIFGGVLSKDSVDLGQFKKVVISLMLESSLRGSESCGLGIFSSATSFVIKKNVHPVKFLKDKEFIEFIEQSYIASGEFFCFIGHSRLVTTGSGLVSENNQPVTTDQFVGVHNGIFLNASSYVKAPNHKASVAQEDSVESSDTLILMDVIQKIATSDSDQTMFAQKLHDFLGSADGHISTLIFDKKFNNLYGFSNTGSLWSSRALVETELKVPIFFASEKNILSASLKRARFSEIIPVKLALRAFIELNTCTLRTKLRASEEIKSLKSPVVVAPRKLTITDRKFNALRRCSKCILPSTYPFITFDDLGVCNYCRSFVAQRYKGVNELEKILEKYRSKDGSPDCLVGLSGGRDSSYGLHLLVNEFNMTPITYTYDWGLTSDKSRRNQSKMAAALGVEHIIRSADIAKKRRHIKKNVEAWLTRPEMGMVPLFMAGDKDFYTLSRTLRKQLNLGLSVFCSGCLLEQREFFVGFCGVNESVTHTARTSNYSSRVKFGMAQYYIKQYLMNWKYLNESLIDSLKSFVSTFLRTDDCLYLYEYIPWDEPLIEKTLSNLYGWEKDEAYGKNQWRMGDGQTAFTNYIFYTVAGFSEFDNFRANQVREGIIDRKTALELAEVDNEPRIETLQQFSSTVGLNFHEVILAINNIPKIT